VSDPEWKSLQRPNAENQTFIGRRGSESNYAYDETEGQEQQWTPEHREFDMQLYAHVEQHLFTKTAPFAVTQPRKKAIVEVQHLGTLAAIHSSLLWLTNKIERLGDNPTHSLQGEHISLERKEKHEEEDKNDPEFSKELPKLSEKLSKLLQSFRSLSEKCLLTLKIEVFIRCCYFLDFVRSCPYHLDAEQKQPDPFILELNRDLTVAFEVLSQFLPFSKLRYIFGRIPYLMSYLLIQSLSKIKAINRFGALKMRRNVLTLQQNFSGLIPCDETPFERARKYYDLVTGSIEGVFQHINEHLSDHTKLFSFEEYHKILEVLSPNHTVSNAHLQQLREYLKQAYLSI